MMLSDTSQFQDVASLLALNNNYCTAEQFVEVEYVPFSSPSSFLIF